MSNNANQATEEEALDQQSDIEDEVESQDSLIHQNQQQKQVQTQPQPQPQQQKQRRQPQYQQSQQQMQQQQYQDPQLAPRGDGYRRSAVRESRIKDRPVASSGASESALKIKIELDLEIEVDLYARVKGDVTIGLM